ncbi:hypothetical protein TWF788_011313 [Orbilia oligospora]|uniref:N-acetyltransferase domain-containing protein n=1 Tax=Orbilia oligospora TaxID=2813651 RepID=A0A7C8KC91_ORBOL|nr:hypothetical protein TWF788_011313 [Orbilia oligospora]KAF3219386.1 hypothetical protein TWF191_007932 [Orbilia oligospora]
MSPAALDDPTAPRKQLSGPNRVDFQPSKLLPLPKSLRDGTEIVITPYINGYHDAPLRPIVETLCEELNGEIERGDTYPMDEIMSVDLFEGYWFGNFAAVVTVRGGPDDGTVLGSFHVKPNYPAARARGVGRVMAETFLVYAPLLGYKSSIFNLVFESNVASCKLWDRLGFTRSGRVKDAGWLKVGGEEKYVDAIVFQKFFDTPEE